MSLQLRSKSQEEGGDNSSVPTHIQTPDGHAPAATSSLASAVAAPPVMLPASPSLSNDAFDNNEPLGGMASVKLIHRSAGLGMVVPRSKALSEPCDHSWPPLLNRRTELEGIGGNGRRMCGGSLSQIEDSGVKNSQIYQRYSMMARRNSNNGVASGRGKSGGQPSSFSLKKYGFESEVDDDEVFILHVIYNNYRIWYI